MGPRWDLGPGLEVYISELDVELTTPVTQEKLIQQANIYKEMIEIALENPQIKLVCLWQFNDAQSWLGAETEACIMDENYTPKPAYDSIQSALIAASEIITNTNSSIKVEEVFQIHSGTINISHTDPGTLFIYNINGQIVNRINNLKGGSFPISHLENGVYVAIFQSRKGIWRTKFINQVNY